MWSGFVVFRVDLVVYKEFMRILFCFVDENVFEWDYRSRGEEVWNY